MMKRKPLTPAEAKRLREFFDNNGGQKGASMVLGGIGIATLSRTVNRHTAPLPLLHEKLVQYGIIV